MCGRYTLTRTGDQLVETFGVPPLSFVHEPRFNIAPGQDVPILAQDRKGRRLGPLTWGFVPAWQREPAAGFINARAEGLTRKRSFREAAERRRCLVPADGFYEWRKDEGRKTPFWFHQEDLGVFTMAGVWEGTTFAIVTTEAGDSVRDVHHRMPLVVEPGDRQAWLDRETTMEDVEALLARTRTWTRRQVASKVGSPANDGPDLIEPV